MAPVKGIGTTQVGYAGPANGPFRCSNCTWYRHDTCGNPDVIADPQMTVKAGRAEVDDAGCCNRFRPVMVNHTLASAKRLAKK